MANAILRENPNAENPHLPSSGHKVASTKAKCGLLSFLAGMLLMPLMTLADAYYDYNDGTYTWHYHLFDGKAFIGYNGTIGVSPKPTGTINVPAKVNGYDVVDIGISAFHNSKWLTQVTIPASVTNIEARGFGACRDLTWIEVDPSNPCYSSQSGVLYDRDKTTIVRCPEGKKSMTIPTSVTRIAREAFSNCDNLTELTIPENVTCIGDSAFSSCGGLAELSIPSSVTNIGDYAFHLCTGLRSVTIPSSVTSIADGMFEYCTALMSVTIPNSVTSIGANAFSSCNGLTSVTIPSSVANIGNESFSGSRMLTIEVEDGNANYSSRDGVLYDKDGTTLVCCPGGLTEMTIPEGVTSIGEYAFGGKKLKSVKIPSSVTNIDARAFSACSGLTFVRISKDVEDQVKEKLASSVPKSVVVLEGEPDEIYTSEYIDGIWWKFTVSDDNATVCGLIVADETSPKRTVVIPRVLGGCSVVGVADYTFAGFSKMSVVKIPQSVTSIGANAFSDCAGLRTIYVDKGEEPRIRGLLVGSGFEHLDFAEGKPDGTYTEMVAGLMWRYAVVNNEAVVGWGQDELIDAVNDSTSGAIVIPRMFDGCPVVKINTYAFSFCEKLTSVTIPSCVTSIGPQAFRHCIGMISVTIPESVANIDAYAFYECSGLGDGVVIVDGCVLTVNGSCPSSVSLPQGVRLIADGAFSRKGMMSVSIPSSVTEIGQGAFESCGELRKILVELGDAERVKGLLAASGLSTESLTFVEQGNPSIAILPEALPSGEAGKPYEVSLSALGGKAPYSWSVRAANMDGSADIVWRTSPDWLHEGLPEGVSLSSDGVLSGTPTTASSNVFVVVAMDANGVGNLREYAIVVYVPPTVEGDQNAVVTGDMENGFVIRPSAGKESVEVTIPDGIDPEKVTIEVTTAVKTVRTGGAKLMVKSGGHDITEYLDLPNADFIDLANVAVKESVVKEALTGEGAVVSLDASNPTITTAATKPGLTYSFREGRTLEAVAAKAEPDDAYDGDGNPWTPKISVSGGDSAFYSLGVGIGK